MIWVMLTGFWTSGYYPTGQGAVVVCVIDVGAIRRCRCCGPRVKSEAAENLLEMHLHGVDRAIENRCDLAVGFAFGNPVQHLRLPQGEAEAFCEYFNRFMVIWSASIYGFCHSCR